MHTQNTTFPVLQEDTQFSRVGTPPGPKARSGRRTLAVAASRKAFFADDIDGVCHDLKGHLATIRMIAAALDTEALPAAVARRLGTLVAEVDTASEMVRRVATHEREVVALDLGAVVQTSVSRAGQLSSCPLACRTAPVLVTGDALQLGRLVDNLLENALRAAGKAGLVAVAVEQILVLPKLARRRATDSQTSEQHALLTVEDSGPGFGRSTPGVASLGLHVVRAVLHEMGGSMEIGTSTLGGALVRITLPAASS